MREPLELRQLAKLAGVTTRDLNQYKRRGLIDLDGDGLVDEMDVLRLRLLMHYRHLGHSVDEIEAAIKAKTPLVLYADSLWPSSEDGEEPLTAEQVAEERDMPVEAVRTILRAVGLGHTIPRSDLQFLDTVKQLVDEGIPLRTIVDLARVYGDTLRRLAQSEVKMIREFLNEPGSGSSTLLKDAGQSRRLQSLQDVVMPMLEPLLLSIHRRYMLRASIQEALADVEAAGRGAERSEAEATIVFIDLASFTSLARVHGDEVAADILDRFDELVRRLLEEHNGSLVKQIGDAFMLVFVEPVAALRFAIHVDTAIARESNFPAVRTGIHAGPVLYRVGDYVGNTVNVAARIAAMAGAHEILITRPVADGAEGAGVRLAATGKHAFQGVDEPVELWRVDRKTDLHPDRDPVCGMAVGDDAVAHMRYEDVEYTFCSPTCLRKFLEEPQRYVAEPDRGSKPDL